MRNIAKLFLLATVLLITLNSCVANPSTTANVVTPATIAVSSTPTLTPVRPMPTPTQVPKGRIIVVTSADNSGPGTLRQAMSDAQPGDTINFDPTAFTPNQPTTIFLELAQPGVALPPLNQGFVSIDASNAGVTLDGKNIPGDFISAIQVASNNNVIQGITFINFSGAAIQISDGQNNLIESNVFGNNGYGIGLWGTTTSANRIEQNFIGVLADGVTPIGNKGTGITIMENAHNNSLGPGNHIAFNQHNGVEILDENSIGNRIFENSIHDNGADGINLTNGGNAHLTAPVLMDFDLAAGRVSGVACSNCEVIIYSDANNEGAQYEGKTVADNQGVFVLEKVSAFSGPSLAATATDERGNTSPFSMPTIGSRRVMEIQSGNTQPRSLMPTKPSDELKDNHFAGIWSNFWQPVDFQVVIDREIVPTGLKRVHMTINEGEYSTVMPKNEMRIDWSKPELSIPPEMDNYVTELVSHDITVEYMLTFWDKANHPNGWEVRSRFKTEEEISRYLEYVRFIISHFKGRVHYYELWNEPNNKVPLQYIEPDDYINLARRTIPVIHDVDPTAKVVFGAVLSPDSPANREYLFKLLNSDVMPTVDAFSWHPFHDQTPTSGQYPDYYAKYPSILAEIINTARQNGFTGEFYADEIGYRGTGCDWCNPYDASFSDIVAAKYAARGIVLHLGNGVFTGTSGLSSLRPTYNNTMRNIANVFAGPQAEEFAVRVQTTSNNFKVFTFAGTDGSKLIALWTDGVAVDDDPGIPSIITIPGFAGWKATGIDVLNGIEQGLITRDENGDLVIGDFLLKDSPVIIRMSE
jgi:hypothetical protein